MEETFCYSKAFDTVNNEYSGVELVMYTVLQTYWYVIHTHW